MSSLSFQNTFIILSKASVTVGTLARKMNTAIAFFVYLWQWISNRNDLLYIGENLGCIMFSLAKSVALSKKFTSFNPRKLLCKLKVSNYQYTGKIVWENKSRYIPSIIIIYHCHHRILIGVFCNFFVSLLQFKYSIDLNIHISISSEVFLRMYFGRVFFPCRCWLCYPYLSKFTIKE